MVRRGSPGLPEVPYTLLARLATEEAVTSREWPVLVRDRVRYPGEAVAVVAMIDPHRIDDLVESNICRCTGYEPIRRAIT